MADTTKSQTPNEAEFEEARLAAATEIQKNLIFAILHFEKGLQSLDVLAEYPNLIWQKELRMVGNRFRKLINRKVEEFISVDSQTVDQFLNVRQLFTDKDDALMEEVEKLINESLK